MINWKNKDLPSFLQTIHQKHHLAQKKLPNNFYTSYGGPAFLFTLHPPREFLRRKKKDPNVSVSQKTASLKEPGVLKYVRVPASSCQQADPQLVGAFSPTHLKNVVVKLDIFPKFRGENRKRCEIIVNCQLTSLQLVAKKSFTPKVSHQRSGGVC